MEPFSDPPGFHRHDESFGAFLSEAAKINEEFERNDRMNLDRGLKMGRALNRAYEMRTHGEWGTELQRLGIPQQRASEAMRAAKLPSAVVSSCKSWWDALKALKLVSKGSGKVVKKRGAPKKKKKPQPCDRCLRIGGPACPDCWENFPEGFPTREPGEDDPEDEEPADTMQDGVIVYDIKKVEKNAFAPARREITKFTKLYSLTEESPELKRLRDAHAAYKQAWIDAIRAASRKQS